MLLQGIMNCKLSECLKDIGINNLKAIKIEDDLSKGLYNTALKELLEERRRIVKKLNSCESKLQCLDYTIREIKKHKETN